MSKRYSRLKPWAWQVRELRARLSEAQGHRCAYCCKDIWGKATLDHVLPVCRGGAWSYDNCVAACAGCNQERSSRCEWKQYKAVRRVRQDIKNLPKFYARAA